MKRNSLRSVWSPVALLLSVGIVGTGCGGGKSEGGVGGEGGGGNKYICPASSGNRSFRISFTPRLNSAPWRTRSLSGIVLVRYDTGLTHDAIVTLNGVELSPEYDNGGYAVPASFEARQGDTLAVCAVNGEDATSILLHCPRVEIASPAEGTAVSPGETVTVTWSGNVYFEDAWQPPAIGISGYDRTRNSMSGQGETVTLSPGDTSATLVVPDTTADEYVVLFEIAGSIERNGASQGACKVDDSVILTKR